MRDEPLQRAIAAAGSIAALAARLNVTHQAASAWERVPIHHVDAVARLLGVEPALVRPDLATVLRGGALECR